MIAHHVLSQTMISSVAGSCNAEVKLTVLSELSLLFRQDQRFTTGPEEQRFAHSLHQRPHCRHTSIIVHSFDTTAPALQPCMQCNRVNS